MSCGSRDRCSRRDVTSTDGIPLKKKQLEVGTGFSGDIWLNRGSLSKATRESCCEGTASGCASTANQPSLSKEKRPLRSQRKDRVIRGRQERLRENSDGLLLPRTRTKSPMASTHPLTRELADSFQNCRDFREALRGKNSSSTERKITDPAGMTAATRRRQTDMTRGKHRVRSLGE